MVIIQNILCYHQTKNDMEAYPVISNTTLGQEYFHAYETRPRKDEDKFIIREETEY